MSHGTLESANELWVEVYDVDNTMLGVVMLASASIVKPLDSIGAISITVPTSDPVAIELLQIWRRVEIYWANNVHGKTFVGGGILLSPSLNINSAQTIWIGQDMLGELRRVNTWRSLSYDDETFFTVITDLVDKVPGWSVAVGVGFGNTSRRFDGQSIIRALLMVTHGKGAHLRLRQKLTFPPPQVKSELTRIIEVGAFGSDSGFMVTNIPTSAYEVRTNPELIIINSLNVIEDGYAIKNRVEPVWGNGDAVLTLKRSTRTSPYPILEGIGPDGRTIYYLEDTASIAQYGVVEGVLTMTDAPYIAADGGVSIINAADVLYDWAVNKLSKLAQPKKIYQVAGLKLDETLRPGDKIRLVYKGFAYHGGVKVTWLDVDDMFWVMSLTEIYGMRGQSITMQISSVDEQIVDAADLIADSLILQDTVSIQQKLFSSQSVHSEDLTVNKSVPGVMTFEVSTFTVAIGQTVLSMTRPNPSKPDTISVAIDGTDRTAELGGPWFVGALDNDPVSVDIDQILDVGDVRGTHTITVSCLLRSGIIVTSVDIVEISVTS